MTVLLIYLIGVTASMITTILSLERYVGIEPSDITLADILGMIPIFLLSWISVIVIPVYFWYANK